MKKFLVFYKFDDNIHVYREEFPESFSDSECYKYIHQSYDDIITIQKYDIFNLYFPY